MSEIELITALKSGDTRAFTILWEKHYDKLVRFSECILKTNLIAEDVVSQTFQKVWERRENFDSLQKVVSFLYTTSRNHCIDHYRTAAIHCRIHKEIVYIIGEPAIEAYPNDYDANYTNYLIALSEKAQRLPRGCRRIFDLYFHHRLSTREIADLLDISEQTVRNQKIRAINLLKKY